jgi:hypothetical protein
LLSSLLSNASQKFVQASIDRSILHFASMALLRLSAAVDPFKHPPPTVGTWQPASVTTHPPRVTSGGTETTMAHQPVTAKTNTGG